MAIESAAPYDKVLAWAKAQGRPLGEVLREELPDLWLGLYVGMTPRRLNVVTFTHGTFDYIYDDYATLEATGLAQPDGVSEARLVGAVGYSKPSHGRRDDSRLRGWVGPTGATFGAAWDKGHFIAHSIGGAVDGLEANVFLQRRSVNRGAYREMERYCAANPGVLCFSRPLYSDLSALPTEVEFGVLKPDDDLWVQILSNRPCE